jgi:hypothetical protein
MDLAYALSAILVGTLRPSETNEERKLLFPQIKKMVGSPDFKNKLIALSPEASTTDLLVQGASTDQLVEQARARFPTHVFIINDCTHTISGPDWKITPVNELSNKYNV